MTSPARAAQRKDSPRSLDSLTALRFFFAFGIVLFHLKFVVPEFYTRRYFDKLDAGVQLFFVLSGFILYYNYGQAGKISLKDFYARRFARIYPLHWITFAAWCAYFLRIWGVPWPTALRSGLANITLTQAFFPGLVFSLGYNSVSWSLSDEVAFYLFFPWLKTLKAAAVVLGLVLVYLLGAHWSGLQGNVNAVFPMFYYFSPLVRAGDFAAGIIAAWFFVDGRQIKNPTLWEVGAVLAMAVALFGFDPPPDLAGLPLLFVAPAFIWIFAHEQGALSRFLARQKLLLLLGEASFSLYMWHMMLIYVLGKHLPTTMPPGLAIGVVFLAAIGFSVVSYRWLETPLRRMTTRRLLGAGAGIRH